MEKGVSPNSFFDGVWKFFTSVKLTVIVLLSLAATSVIGTVIPQNESNAAYFQEYGEVLYRIFHALSIFDMYHSWWFQFLLLVLIINIVICSLDRLSGTWNIIFTRSPKFSLSRFRKLSDKEEFSTEILPEKLRAAYESSLSKRFGHTRAEDTETGFCIFGEKGRWTRFGVYIVHISVILLVAGGLIGSIFGFEGFVNIPEGEGRDHIRLKKTLEAHHLDFSIRCDDFSVSFYDSGAPKEYRSHLTLLENGVPVLQKSIIVNDPLRYKGINIFQSSYGSLPPKAAVLSFVSRESGMEYTVRAELGKPFDMPEGTGTFVLKTFERSYSFMGRTDIGEVFIGVLTPKEGESAELVIPLHYPNFDKMRRGNFVISVADHDSDYYTGLQITKDPGVMVVYAGFIIMILGFFITFFMSHQRVCAELTENGGKTRVIITGMADKNKMGMKNRMKLLSRRLEELASGM